MRIDRSTAAWTSAYDIPPSLAAKASPHRYSHEAAFASRANEAGSAINPRLCRRADSSVSSATTRAYTIGSAQACGTGPSIRVASGLRQHARARTIEPPSYAAGPELDFVGGDHHRRCLIRADPAHAT